MVTHKVNVPYKDIARRIVTGYINSLHMDFTDQVIELASVNDSDEVLLDHVEAMIKVLTKAKKEILDSKEGDKNENNK